ncbi:Stc1 domain-containing protein [Xylaria flabelliformis]|nr:Stc1 domain-containing protein [Xylaria flabelliformis]
MAFRNPVGGAALPPTFRCRVCGKNKAPAAYSKSQLQKWYNKKRNDRGNKVTPDNVGLSCQDHNNEEREIRCHGPCDLIKVVGQFSKNQRNDPEPWCTACTEWRLGYDGTEPPNDVPNGPLVRSGDDGVSNGAELALETSAMSSDEDDDDDDFGEVNPYSGSKTLVSSFIDRLEGYGDEADCEVRSLGKVF